MVVVAAAAVFMELTDVCLL